MNIALRFYLSEKEEPDLQLKNILSHLNVSNYLILRKSIDAREKERIVAEYHLKIPDKITLNRNQALLNKNKIQSIKEIEGKKKTFDIENYLQKIEGINKTKNLYKPIIIGFGPSAIFAAFSFLENGIIPIIIEMGEEIENRNKTIERFFKDRIFNQYSNINFGEGGAGTYSDGKLLTRSRDELNNRIFSIFNYFGAPNSIMYDANPHIGSDNLIKLIVNIREYLIQHSVQIIFNTALIDLKREEKRNSWVLKLYDIKSDDLKYLETDNLILATGHSSREIYRILYELGAKLEAKPFALGFRVEHPRDFIDKNQYGKFYKTLPSANYKLLYKGNYSNIYSFCMCPGGVVLPSNSNEEEIVTNGASRYSRDGINSNSAIVASISNKQALMYIDQLNNDLKNMINVFCPGCLSVNKKLEIKKKLEIELGLISKNKINLNLTENNRIDDFEIINFKKTNKIEFLNWEANLIVQQFFEKISFFMSNQRLNAPFENIEDFFEQKQSLKTKICTTYPFDLYGAKLLKLFNDQIEKDFLNAFNYFDKILPGFISNGIAIGYETRTSSVIKVLRDESGMILNGIYMIGEGSGYCGGITTSCVDGYKVASLIAKKLI